MVLASLVGEESFGWRDHLTKNISIYAHPGMISQERYSSILGAES
jgi:hypothetical protein